MVLVLWILDLESPEFPQLIFDHETSAQHNWAGKTGDLQFPSIHHHYRSASSSRRMLPSYTVHRPPPAANR